MCGCEVGVKCVYGGLSVVGWNGKMKKHSRGILFCVLGSVGRMRGSALNDCCMLARRGSRGKPDLNIAYE